MDLPGTNGTTLLVTPDSTTNPLVLKTNFGPQYSNNSFRVFTVVAPPDCWVVCTFTQYALQLGSDSFAVYDAGGSRIAYDVERVSEQHLSHSTRRGWIFSE